MGAHDRHETEAWRALRAMSAEESLAIGVALWTSDLARLARPCKAPRPPSLAVALRLDRRDRRGRIVR